MTETTILSDAGVDALPQVMVTMQEAFDLSFGEAWTQSQCLGILSLPGVWMTVASRAGTPVGFALSRIVADEAELLLLAVRPGFRRTGAGLLLLASTRDSARARGARKLFLEVRNGNPARALYDVAGFRPIGCRTGYYRGRDGSLHDAHTLEHDLTLR